MTDEGDKTLTVYVPAEDSELLESIAPGSAIVGSEYEDTGRLRVDFEGNIYGLEQLKELETKLQRAAERHLANDGRGAETVACAYVDRDEVVAVGKYEVQAERIAVSADDRLQGWLDENTTERS